MTFLSYSVFDELHYLKKPWRNFETSSLLSKQRLVSWYSRGYTEAFNIAHAR